MASKKSFKFWFWTTYIAAAGWTILYTYFGHFLITDNRLPILCHFDSRKFSYHGGQVDCPLHWFWTPFITDGWWSIFYTLILHRFCYWWRVSTLIHWEFGHFSSLFMGNLSRHWLWTLFIIDFRCAFFIDLQYCTLFIIDGGYAIFEFYFGHVFITEGGWVML